MKLTKSYRWVKVGEILRENDQYYEPIFKTWEKTENPRLVCSLEKAYRRRQTKKKALKGIS